MDDGFVSELNDIAVKTMDDGFVSELNDIAVKTLAELRFGTKEAELSEEELRINDQLQEDELLALESIYGDGVVILNRKGGLRCFQVRIHVETPNELTISTELHSTYEDAKFRGNTGSSTASVGSSNEVLSTIKVQHLPPIVLTCLLPMSYPSHLPPFFTIYVKWLDCMRISKLCHMLDSIWLDQPGHEVMYPWVEWIHSSSLSYLGVDCEVTLVPYNIADDGDKRAILGDFSPEADIPFILNYNDAKSSQVFRESLHECFICFGEYAGIDFFRLPCKHFFCSKCMKTYASMHVKEGTIDMLLCPDAKCKGLIPPDLLKCMLEDEEFKRWESLSLRKTLDSMPDVLYCPRCETICLEDEDNHAQCPMCFFSFCSLCNDQRHIGRPCTTREQKLDRLEEKTLSSTVDDEQSCKLQQMKDELLSVKEIERNSKQCPTCKMAVSRTEGCNKMKCTYCGKPFCYLCGMAISGYDHFGDDCDVFAAKEIERRELREQQLERKRQWSQRLEKLQELQQLKEVWRMEALEASQKRAELLAGADRAHSCPVCRQRNAKVGNNNHIICWSCKTHYCYLCLKTVQRISGHYGTKGCKQHTVG